MDITRIERIPHGDQNFYGVIFVINLIIIVKKIYPAYVDDFNR